MAYIDTYKGLTARDRELWDKQYKKQFADYSDEDKDILFHNTMFKRRFGKSPEWEKLKNLPMSEREAYWNKNYDDSIKAVRQAIDKKKTPKIDNNIIAPTETIKSDATKVDRSQVEKALDITPKEQEDFKKRSLAYNSALQKYTDRWDKTPYYKREAISGIKNIAEEVSPHYKAYKDDYKMDLSEQEWEDIAKDFNASKDAYGEDVAIHNLQRTLQNKASENQSLAEKYYNGFAGLGASIAGFGISAGGMLYGMAKYASGNGTKTEGLSGWGNFLNNVFDNEVTRYGDDIIKTASLSAEDIKKWKDLGLSRAEVIQTAEQQNMEGGLADVVFNKNFIPSLISQHGFTIASMLAGGALAKGAELIFGDIKGIAVVNAANTGKKAMQIRNALSAINKTEKAVNRFAIPGIVGTVEGAMNGLNTKLETIEEGEKALADAHAQVLDEEFQNKLASEFNERYHKALMETPYVKTAEGKMAPSVDPDVIKKQVLDELWNEASTTAAKRYKDSKDQLEFAASKAGISDFMTNSVINGLLNSTLKATLFQPKTFEGLRQTRLGRLISPSGGVRMTDNGAKAVLPWYSKAWNIVKEPVGEGLEEYTQDISSSAWKAGGTYNIGKFIDNKYNGDGRAVVGDEFADYWGAALNAAGEAALSKESARSFIYGAAASVLGGPHIAHRATAVDKDGKPLKNKDGKVQKTLFGRGLNSAGELESNFERLARLTPWRSGAIQAYNENKAKQKNLENTAESINNWMQSTANKDKYDGIVGSFMWARGMETSAANNDVFGYKNSELGKTINDMMMLEKTKGSEFYNSFMDNVVASANLQEGTKEANDAIEMMRSNIATKNVAENMSDAEILDMIKSNATKMLEVQSQISEIGKKVDRTFGNLDDDTKASLIYGELQIKDWKERAPKVEETLKKATEGIENTTTGSSLNEDQKELVATYGSLAKAQKAKEDLIKEKEELEKQIAIVKKRKKQGLATEEETLGLSDAENAVKGLKQQIARFSSTEEGEEEGVLSEAEIMSLSPLDRAIMLNPRNLNKYSEKQQAVIENLIARASAEDSDFYNNIQDAAKIDQATVRYVNQYSQVLSDPTLLNLYAFNAKQAAIRAGYKNRFDDLNSLTDYTEFAHAMDKLYTDASASERSTILSQFEKEVDNGGNANYLKYRDDRQTIVELLNNASHNEDLNDLSDNDLNLFIHGVTYLTEKGVNLLDNNAVVETLSEEDSDGELLFKKYVDSLNSTNQDAIQTEFTGIEDVIGNIETAVKKYRTDDNNTKVLHTPVVAAPTSTSSNNPTQVTLAKPVDVAPAEQSSDNVFNTAATTLEEADEDLKNSGETRVEQNSSPIVQQALNNSNPQVADVVSKVEGIFNTLDTNEKEESNKLLEEVVEDHYSNEEEFLNALSSKIGTVQDAKLRDKLFEIQGKVLASRNVNRSRNETKAQAKQKYSAIQNNTLFNRIKSVITGVNTSANRLQSLSFSWLKSTHTSDPNNDNYSPLLAYLERHHVEEYLQKDKLTRDTPVYFMYDPVLSAEVQEEWRKNGYTFEESNLPVIAVVEETINGEKYYQPIGIMPPTNSSNYSGSGRLKYIRDNINKNATESYLISSNGKPIETRPHNHVRANTPKQLPVGQNKSVIQALTESLSAEEKADLQKKGTASNAYKKMKKFFLDNVKVSEKISKSTGKSYKILTLDVKTLKNGATIPVDFFVADIENTPNVVNKLKQDDISVLENSRISLYLKKLSSIANSINPDKISFTQGTAGIVPTEGTNSYMQELEERLNTELSDFIGIREHSYQLTPVYNESTNSWSIVLSLVKDGDLISSIHLGNLSKEALNDKAIQLQLIKNLILDPSTNTVRKLPSGEEVAHWNINYANVNTSRDKEASEGSRDAATADLNHIFDEDLLEVSKDKLQYGIEGIELENPFNTVGQLRSFEPAVTNKDNASASTPVSGTHPVENPTTDSNGNIVDANTGSIIQKGNNGKSTVIEECKKIVDKIVADSNELDLTEDEDSYVNKNTQERYLRVTSIISADESSEERFDPNSVWALPSTNIGTGIDELVRSFFDGTITNNNGVYEVSGTPVEEVFPNISKAYAQMFLTRLEAFKQGLISRGITIIPRDIKCSGTLTTTDSQGVTHNIPVAGTLDLLGYDKDGNWHIFDMKTFRSSTKEAKWSMQTSLYKKFLEDKYGINVVSTEIIPIKVAYPTPSNRNVYTVSSESKHPKYSGKDNNQLMLNGEAFKGVNPSLMPLITLNTSQVKLVFDKLTQEEKELLQNIEERINSKDAAVNQGNPEGATNVNIVKAAVDSSNALPPTDPLTNLPKLGGIGSLFGGTQQAPPANANDPINKYVRADQNWNNLPEEAKKALRKQGITEANWNNKSNEERQQFIDCLNDFLKDL